MVAEGVSGSMAGNAELKATSFCVMNGIALCTYLEECFQYRQAYTVSLINS